MYDVNKFGWPSNYKNNNNQNANYGYPMGFNLTMTKCCRKSYFRILNALKNAPKLDVYVNEMLMTSNLGYGEFSRFMKFMPGTYHIVAKASGSQNGPIFESNITIDANLVYTGALTGDAFELDEINLYMIPDEKEHYDMGMMSALKIINLVIDSPYLNLVSDDGTVLFSDVKYGDVTNNVAIPSNTYTLHLKKQGNDQSILTAPNLDFLPKMYYTLFLIGEYGESIEIELLIPEDGINNLDMC